MSVAPLPAIINHPWFIADIPGWNNDGVASGESFKEDRTYLEHAIKEREISRHLPLTVSTLLCNSGMRLFSNQPSVLEIPMRSLSSCIVHGQKKTSRLQGHSYILYSVYILSWEIVRMYRNSKIYWGEKWNISVDNEGLPSFRSTLHGFQLRRYRCDI
jgi:hypothetical protein